jgi:hypothetical protein
VILPAEIKTTTVHKVPGAMLILHELETGEKGQSNTTPKALCT